MTDLLLHVRLGGGLWDSDFEEGGGGEGLTIIQDAIGGKIRLIK